MLKKIINHRLFHNSASLIFLQLVNYVTPLIILIYLTDVLGIEKYGVVAFSVSIFQIAIVILDFGLSLSATERISVVREKKKHLSRYIGGIFVVKMVLFLMVSLAMLIFAFTTSKYEADKYIFILTLFPIFASGFQMIWFFSGIEKMFYIAFYMIMGKIVHLLLIFALVKEKSDYILVPIAHGAGLLVALLICFISFKKIGYSIAIPRRREIFYVIASSKKYFISRMSSVVSNNGGVFLLGVFGNASQVALYSIAHQLFQVMQSTFLPIIQAAFPFMARDKNILLYLRISVYVLVAITIGACLGYFVGPTLIDLVFGSEWSSVLEVFNILLIAVIVNVISVLSGYPLAVGLGRVSVANQSIFYGAFAYFLIFVIMYFVVGISPTIMAVVFLCTEIFTLLYRGILLWPLTYKFIKE